MHYTPLLATGLLTTVRMAVPQLQQQEHPAILVTNGGFGLDDPRANEAVIQYKVAAVGLQNAIKQKLVDLLHEELRPKGVYVGKGADIQGVRM